MCTERSWGRSARGGRPATGAPTVQLEGQGARLGAAYRMGSGGRHGDAYGARRACEGEGSSVAKGREKWPSPAKPRLSSPLPNRSRVRTTHASILMHRSDTTPRPSPEPFYALLWDSPPSGVFGYPKYRAQGATKERSGEQTNPPPTFRRLEGGIPVTSQNKVVKALRGDKWGNVGASDLLHKSS